MTKHFIKYNGPVQHTRILIAADELLKGRVLPGDLTWSPENDHTVIVEDMEEETLAWFRRKENDFSVREVPAGADDPEAGDPEGDPADPDGQGELPVGAAGLAETGDPGATGKGTAGKAAGTGKGTAGSR